MTTKEEWANKWQAMLPATKEQITQLIADIQRDAFDNAVEKLRQVSHELDPTGIILQAGDLDKVVFLQGD